MNLSRRLSPLEAYRSDLAQGASDGSPPLGVALLLWEAEGEAKSTRASLAAAAAEARRLLTPEQLKRGCTYDGRAARSNFDVIRLLAQDTEHRGYLHVANSLLESLAGLPGRRQVEVGRLTADRARVARKLGRTDLAEGRARSVLAIGNALKRAELQARAFFELAAVAQVRGNYPQAEKSATSGWRHATRAGNRALIAGLTSALGLRAALRRDFATAVKHFGTAYALARHPEPQFFEAVANLAQVALDSGEPRFALRIATHGLQHQPPLQSALALLGTAVLAAAAEGDARTVDWASDEVRRLVAGDRHPRESALALTECAEAQHMLGNRHRTAEFRRGALRLATAFGLHEIEHRLSQNPPPPPARVPLPPSRVAILAGVGSDAPANGRVTVGV